MSNKTAYEIRLDLLHLASTAAQRQLEFNIKAWEAMSHVRDEAIKAGRLTFEEVMKAMTEISSTLPKVDDLIKEAEKLNTFVSGVPKKRGSE